MATLRDVRGIDVLNEAVALDSMAFGPHKDLYSYEMNAGNTEKAAIHRAYLMKLVPWYVPRLDSLARLSAARHRQNTGE